MASSGTVIPTPAAGNHSKNLKRRVRHKVRLVCLFGLYAAFLLCGFLSSGTSVQIRNRRQIGPAADSGEDGDVEDSDSEGTGYVIVQPDASGDGQHVLLRHLLADSTEGNDVASRPRNSSESNVSGLPTTPTSTTTTATAKRSPPPTNPVDADDEDVGSRGGSGNGTANCIPPAIDEFPADFMTPLQRSHGGLVVHILIAAYVLLTIAIACDDYFVTSLEGISSALSLSSDVAGATFMAAGSSAPELFTNVVGTFVTEGDLGVGTIVGSAVFNILGVTALCGLFVPDPIPVDFWALTRDCIFYFLSVVLLILVMNNDVINWWEGLIFVLAYASYILVMKYNSRIENQLKSWLQRRGWDVGALNMHAAEEENEQTPLLSRRHRISSIASSHSSGEFSPERKASSFIHRSFDGGVAAVPGSGKSSGPVAVAMARRKSTEEPSLTFLGNAANTEDEGYWEELITAPDGAGARIYWVISWPARFVLRATIPDCGREKLKKWYPVTFGLSIVWIGSLSYLAAWMITVIGHTFGIPDSVMGLTFLAAGTSVPELASSLVVAKQGLGSMSMSNLVGSNTFDILICLGLPWLIKAAMSGQVLIQSSGLTYSAVALLSTVFLMYSAMVLNKFHLGKPVGFACLVLYVIFLVVALMVELNVFGVVNLPSCPTNS